MSNDGYPAGWDSGYDQFIEEAERDDRLGKHIAVVSGSPVEDAWEGKGFVKVPVMLTTAHNSKLELTIFDKTPVDVLKTMDSGKRSAEGWALKRVHKPLAVHYGITDARQLTEGKQIGVLVEYDKKYFKKTGKNWPKIVEVIKLEDVKADNAAQAKADGGVGF